MQYSRAKCIIVYSSLRNIFSKPENAALRKSKAIKAVVQRHRLAVSFYSEKDLIQILQHLLKQGIFESIVKARSVYPELFPSPAVQKQIEQLPKPSSVPDRNLSIMEEQKARQRELFNTGEYSDIELVSADKLYEAHRVIVCPWSPVIKKSFEFNAAKSDRTGPEPTEFGNGITKASFNFGDADPQAVDCMVQFFYLWDYNPRSLMPKHILGQDGPQENETDVASGADDTTTPKGSLLILHSKVFTLAHIYDIPRLRDLSIEKFQEVARLQWRSNCLLDAAREAYTATPSTVLDMRRAIVKTFYEHRELLGEDHVKDFLREVHELTFDILMYMDKPPSPPNPSSFHGFGRGFR
ncbi:hypothetical protein IWW34DRAFT_381953 [Fusarium oxysporum f. sp. albedinis]|uniref:BTB domain-containing protein n=1 Tax=Fusarium oxysporum f. sp. raphani TaxID=96318 RepID=A0A8J5NS48_FUSOX|nr:hypothetical protein Forpi1262_v017604 [Fusarium oxysporum f. sp. raphani]KAI3567923.1 hypothetical protein IWW34DRAFT_381953 [Fusarium oxysporum f. sp. albedinis]KAJ0134441.1 hypothetical protein HZ326_22498 [Fusarium oxysporum f. sp. albedinis]KAK2469532.1 hypothetical protein H9L39_18803 [Fusarium oxysporum f. sp. albedinis]